ncbi:flagellar motor stator protein MotA [Vagococcus carniphilus]|uniref:Flagellar motor stator protein MotA n=1 Tax=Vagococcus carniphilus TaxID=218144 RepID=A0AAW8U6W7_9ENTE|nr:flagellar motor stator protein MotA [Vagococcus carniphilus]MDT2815882.1 flagellar motor stator protein MotA [Vagococcus carniphilus]MDT2833691.1 flagellar motor stator protein MotA [Vagococcus carniphilus]MDT2847644.1 flagellar motor stator protein MotA [Vagococcus carniphilus]MDT2865103.1 flagellar motor stator protein MotA [Vagococcus carniphilus]
MDIFLILGIIMGFISVIVGMIVKGADAMVLLNPAAAIIIGIGTLAALVNAYPKNDIKRLPKIFGVLFKSKENAKPEDLVETIMSLAQKARQEGILALESTVDGLEDPFLKNGMEMVVDGVNADQIEEVLANEIEALEERHRVGSAMFKTAGSSAPTLGVLGAVIGLIGALGNLNDVNALGHMISAAFVATLYGIFFGYVLFIPFGSRLARKSESEVKNMMITVEGVLAIQAGHNPNTIERKLLGMLDPNEKSGKE